MSVRSRCFEKLVVLSPEPACSPEMTTNADRKRPVAPPSEYSHRQHSERVARCALVVPAPPCEGTLVTPRNCFRDSPHRCGTLGMMTEAWYIDAVCVRPEYRTTRFFWIGTNNEPKHLRDEREAKAKLVCAICPVRTECAAWALDKQAEYGVWGGLGEEERGFVGVGRVFRTGGFLVRDWNPEDSVCGTRDGWFGHITREEAPCPVCVRWAFARPRCGEPSGIAEHIRNKQRCPACFSGKERPFKRKRTTSKLSEQDCGTPDGWKYHRQVLKDTPCGACAAFRCNTEREYFAHIRHGETPDAGCKSVHSKAERERQKRRARLADHANAKRAAETAETLVGALLPG